MKNIIIFYVKILRFGCKIFSIYSYLDRRVFVMEYLGSILLYESNVKERNDHYLIENLL